jgi:fucose 4-O-acetylase-like acetyltransferase
MDTERIPWFDNIKGLLIFLVVFGHIIEIYRGLEGNEVVKYLYDIIYFFHMPLFIMISGYFFRPNKFERVLQLLGIFIIWQSINGIISKFIHEQSFVSLTPESRIFSIFDPYWTLWYLIGIVVWSIMTPYILKLRYPLLMTIMLAVLITYAEGVTSWFSLRKLVNFYPYFLTGYYLADKRILFSLANEAYLWKKTLRWVASTTIIAFLASMWYFTKLPQGTELLFMRESYSYFDWGFVKGAFIHILMYLAVTVLSFSFIILVPMNKRMLFFNNLGVFSVFIYLMHTNIVRLFREFVPPYIVENPMILILVSIVSALIISWFLSIGLIRKIFKPLVEPSLKWVIKEENTKLKNSNKKHIA